MINKECNIILAVKKQLINRQEITKNNKVVDNEKTLCYSIDVPLEGT